MTDRATRDQRARRLARAVRILIAAVAILAITYWIASPTIRSAALLMDMTGVAPGVRAWLPVRTHAVTTEDVQVETRFGSIAARVYRGASGPAPALLMVPGVHAGGVDEPRLDKLARRIAAAGANVLSTPLPDLRAYRLTTRATDMIEDAGLWLAARPNLAPSGRIGIVAVSFAGGLALVAAGRPALADRLTGVFALGAHADLPRVIRYLCMDDGAPRTLAPPHDYGVVLMLRESIPLVVPAEQQAGLNDAVVTFLNASSAESTDRALSARIFEDARTAETRLAEPARSLMHAVNQRDVATLGRLLAPHAEQIGGADALSPVRSPATRVPLFLLHGVNDNVIPSSETNAIEEYVRRAGNTQLDVLLTPLVTHADARPDVSALDVWRLVRFWTRMWSAFER